MFEQNNGWEKYLPICLLNIFLSQSLQILLISCFLWTLKLESAWDHTMNIKFNDIYSTVTNVFLILYFTFSTFFKFSFQRFSIYGPEWNFVVSSPLGVRTHIACNSTIGYKSFPILDSPSKYNRLSLIIETTLSNNFTKNAYMCFKAFW